MAQFALPKLPARTLAFDCYRAIKRAILTLELAPGSALVENVVATQLGVSKTPLREALRQLAVEGLVVIQPGRTTHVAEFSASHVREILQTRLIIEPSAIRHLPCQLTCDELEQLACLVNRAAAALDRHDLNDYVQVGERFHAELIAHHHNEQLSIIAARLFEHSQRFWAAVYRAERSYEHQERSRAGIENHVRIVQALRAGDLEEAAQMIESDISTFLRYIDEPAIQDVLHELNVQRLQRD